MHTTHIKFYNYSLCFLDSRCGWIRCWNIIVAFLCFLVLWSFAKVIWSFAKVVIVAVTNHLNNFWIAFVCVCVCVFLELSLIWMFYDKTQTEQMTFQFVVYLITNMVDIFDICMTVHHWYNNINNQLDATITVY